MMKGDARKDSVQEKVKSGSPRGERPAVLRQNISSGCTAAGKMCRALLGSL